jgi:mannose-1-phosphate guanylyltransferase/mannose-6-phosphate isomerase
MAKPKLVSFVLSGGVGSRLWPLSREDNPKQFLDLGGGSLLVRTVERLAARPDTATSINIIASDRHAARIAQDLAAFDLAGGRLILEPSARNTASAVAIATLDTMTRYGDEFVLVVPSDHEIGPVNEFWRTVESGLSACADRIMLFGVRPTRPETGYGYVETEADDAGSLRVSRFIEKPERVLAAEFVKSDQFFWNTGIFLFRASVMQQAFANLAPDVWQAADSAYRATTVNETGCFLDAASYAAVRSVSLDYAIMEKASNLMLTPATFTWSDVGSWKALLQVSSTDSRGNAISGDVVALDCRNSYIRADGQLVSVIGLDEIAVVATPDATFVAPVSRSEQVRALVAQLEEAGRLETRYTPAPDKPLVAGAWRERVNHWLFEQALPFWSTNGVDHIHGGFFEALDFRGAPVEGKKRTRTIARQIYAFAVAKLRGWGGQADALVNHGLDFLNARGRSSRGGWVHSFGDDGSPDDGVEDAYDHACVLLALAFAHASGHPDARRLGDETLLFIDNYLTDPSGGLKETPGETGVRRSNPHMHMLEALLAWNRVTGNPENLERAGAIVDRFKRHFFDHETWTVGEHFDADWRPRNGQEGEWTEPGHHFEWAALLVDYAERSGERPLFGYARKIYASAIANGLNRATGLAFGAVSREATPLDSLSRSWPQAEAVKAALALDRAGGPDLKPEIEQRVARLFRWHIDPAPPGLWIDRIDQRGASRAASAPASILYHLVTALTQYLDATKPERL